jgi:HSP20 family molecular chaperone IbpA
MANSNPQSELQPRGKHELRQEGTRPGVVFQPDVDILEQADAYVVHADVPGAGPDSVSVRLENGTLTLDAGVVSHAEPSWTPIHAEYRIGGYHREFRMSEDIDAGAVSASVRDGVLTLRLPKRAASRPRQIRVQST